MKTLKLIALAAFALLFSQCKTTAPTAPSGPAPSLLEVHLTLDTTAKIFLRYADTTKGDPWKAIMLTAKWLKNQSNVTSATVLDSTYIQIVLKSGLTAMFSFDQVDDSGVSIFKGGGKRSADSHVSVSGLHSKNTIENKKVLIYSAGNQDFYKNNEIQATYNLLKKSSVGLDVTLLIDEQCTPAIVDHFPDYGLVIIDSHGTPTSFMTGIVIDIPAVRSIAAEDPYKNELVSQQGPALYDAVMSGDYEYWYIWKVDNKIPNWQQRDAAEIYSVLRIAVTTKHLAKLPAMDGTVLMGSMCYSGAENPQGSGLSPMKTSILSKNPISYFSFAYDDGSSAPVSVKFAKKVEDSLVDALVIDFDSTKTANLQLDHLTEYFDPTNKVRNLWFKHFGADDYSYQKCGDSIIDVRDGQKYATVCIGKQVWMAQNLNFNAPGSKCYNDQSSNCDIYGKLYNWNTAMNGAAASNTNPSNVQGICPKGWHLPSAAEWTQLVDALGGDQIAGGALKTTTLWQQPNTGATNSSGFNGVPGGFCLATGGTIQFSAILGYFLSSSLITVANQTPVPGLLELSAYGSTATYTSTLTSHDMDGLEPCRCVKDK